MARYYTITIKHAVGATIWQGQINTKKIKALIEYANQLQGDIR